MERKDRRVRIYMVNLQCLAIYFQRMDEWPHGIAFSHIEGPPDGARVISTAVNALRDCVDVLLEHESFDDVPLGEEPPRVNAEGTRNVILVRQEDGRYAFAKSGEVPTEFQYGHLPTNKLGVVLLAAMQEHSERVKRAAISGDEEELKALEAISAGIDAVSLSWLSDEQDMVNGTTHRS